MPARVARTAAAALCATALLALVAAPASAKAPRARASVIGGRLANLQDWGFTAAVLTPNTLCSGIVLSPTKVLTAAHCVRRLSTMIIRTGSTSAFAGGQASGVAAAAIAPGRAHSFKNDLAVLTLKSPTSAPPLQLADGAEDAAYTRVGAPLQIAGFGNRNPIRGRHKVGLLTAADVTARNCLLPSWAICDYGGRAGAVVLRFKKHRRLKRKVKKSVCSGDSGGPLVARTPNGPRLIGVAEASSSPSRLNPFFSVICGLKGFPSLHSRTASQLSFIHANVP
jgi:secreted trypsin-like serine protease